LTMWSAAILTGGHARRYDGRDKSALVVGGRSILDRQVAELTTITSEILLVGDRGPETAPPLTRRVADRVPGCGPLGGLHAALSAAAGDATILIACDMPYVTGPLLGHLLALTRQADAVVPCTEGGYHPLCAAYTRACLAPVAARLAEGRLKMSDLFDDLRVRLVTAVEIDAFGRHDRLLANVNTAAEYGNLEAFQSHQL
jgi:molybdopterin-guanine dinucleotide biosynthesis protein A